MFRFEIDSAPHSVLIHFAPIECVFAIMMKPKKVAATMMLMEYHEIAIHSLCHYPMHRFYKAGLSIPKLGAWIFLYISGKVKKIDINNCLKNRN